MRRYLEILRVPHLGAMCAASLLARLPMGINGLAIVLLLRAETGSFAAPARRRARSRSARASPRRSPRALIDRFGQRVMPLLAAVHAAGLAGDRRAGARRRARRAAARRRGWSPASPSRRRRPWSARSTRSCSPTARTLLHGAFALDSVLTETIFTVGPLLTAALVAVVEPAAALLGLGRRRARRHAARSCAALPPARAASDRALGRPPRRARGARASARSWPRCSRSASRSARSRSRSPRSPTREGRPELAGVLIAIWSVASAHRRPRLRREAAARTLAGPRAPPGRARCCPLSFLPLALAVSPATMALLVRPGGRASSRR